MKYYNSGKHTIQMGTEYYDISGPFYVFDNIHDWLNEVNLGNGLATILSFPSGYDGYRDNISKPDEFIRRANEFLSIKTSMTEIRRLLRHHHPYYKCADAIQNFVFRIDKKGNIRPSDPAITRCVQIRNAFIKCMNSKYGENIPFISREEAVKIAIPQLTPLEDGINVADVLNVDVMLQRDTTIYGSCVLDYSLLKDIFNMMLQANNLIALNGYVKTNLLDKYFHCTNKDYLPGTDMRFYLGGKVQHFYPETHTDFKNIGFKTVGSIAPITRCNIKKNFPSIEGNALEQLIARYVVMYSINEKTGQKYTPLEFVEQIENDIILTCYPERGVGTNIVTIIKHLYKIPVIMLHSNYQQLVAYKSVDKDITKRIRVVKEYFYNLFSIYKMYME